MGNALFDFCLVLITIVLSVRKKKIDNIWLVQLNVKFLSKYVVKSFWYKLFMMILFKNMSVIYFFQEILGQN